MRTRAIGSKVKQHKDIMTTNAIAPSIAKKTGSSTVDTNSTCSHRRSGENKCGHSMPNSAGRVCATQSIYIIDIDRENRNFYSCRGFDHLV